jgi:hypothetical protein
VGDILIAVVDGLKGLGKAIGVAFPQKGLPDRLRRRRQVAAVRPPQRFDVSEL